MSPRSMTSAIRLNWIDPQNWNLEWQAAYAPCLDLRGHEFAFELSIFGIDLYQAYGLKTKLVLFSIESRS